MLPSQLYGLQSLQSIIIDPWYTYNRPWYVYHIWNSCDRVDFDIFASLFPFFSRTPHPAIVFHCKFLTRNIFWYFTSSFWSSIVYQLQPNFILKKLYCQGPSKLHNWFYHPIILKVPWCKSCINFWRNKIPGKVTIWKELGCLCTL